MLVCRHCGSESISRPARVDVNDGEVVKVDDGMPALCHECDREGEPMMAEDYERQEEYARADARRDAEMDR